MSTKIKTVHFDDWLAEQPRGAQAKIYREVGVSFGTMWNAQKRIPVKHYEVARRLSEATGGIVTIKALCEPAPV